MTIIKDMQKEAGGKMTTRDLDSFHRFKKANTSKLGVCLLFPYSIMPDEKIRSKSTYPSAPLTPIEINIY